MRRTEEVTPLEGRRALVTGGASGIGRAIALALADAGAAVNDLVASAALREVARGVRSRGRRTLVAPGDVSQADAVAAIFEAVTGAFGGLDIHVNNAGVMLRGPLLEVSSEDWRRVL